MEKTVTLEGSKLKHIADRNDTAQLVMFSLADRKRFRSVTDIGHLKNLLIRSGEKIVNEDYMKTFKELEALGVGSIIYGRNGKSNRFEWNYSLKAIGEAAMSGKNVEVKAIKHTHHVGKKRFAPATTPKLELVETKPETRTLPQITKTVLYIPLREDFVIDLQIPNDVTSKELESIHNALKRFG